jgi:hypothetical protein
MSISGKSVRNLVRYVAFGLLALNAGCSSGGVSGETQFEDEGAAIGEAEASNEAALSSFAMKGYADPLFGSKTQNRCLMNVTQAFNSLPSSPVRNRYQSRGGASLPPFNKTLRTFEACVVDWNGNSTIDRHIQGVARLPGVGDNRWLAVTRAHNLEYAGVHLVHMGDLDGADGTRLLIPGKSYKDPPPDSRRTEAFYSQYLTTHPGGVQSFGKYLAIAVEATNEERPRIDLYDFSGGMTTSANVGNYYLGNLGESPTVTKSITGVAVTRLSQAINGGRYLFFVLGKDTAKNGWFYVSDTGTLTRNSKLQFLDYVDNTDTTPSGAIREYQNVNLITECGSGDIYLLGTGNPGYAGSAGSGDNFADLFRLSMSGNSVRLERTARRSFQEGGADSCTFRAGATSYVDKDGRLLLYCHTHHANTDIFCDPDSKLKWTEYSYSGCPNADSGTCCSASATSCGDGNCCGSAERCMADGPQMGTCCATGKVCGSSCCGATDTCMGNSCCSAAKKCGSVCCSSSTECKDASRSMCCGAFDTVCGNTCCGPTQACVNGTCQTPPPPPPSNNCGVYPSCSTIADCPANFSYCNGCCRQIR